MGTVITCLREKSTRVRIFSCALRTGSAAVLCAVLAAEVYARVGGGQSYGGKGGSGGDGAGGAIIYLIFQLVRLLLYLTIEYPIVGIPLDIIVIAGVIYFFWRRSQRHDPPTTFSTAATGAGVTEAQPRADGFAREFQQLRKFDPNFSEIVFTDFCYALYARAHVERAGGAKTLDLFSPYLSDAARSALLQRNSPGLGEVKGVIVGA